MIAYTITDIMYILSIQRTSLFLLTRSSNWAQVPPTASPIPTYVQTKGIFILYHYSFIYILALDSPVYSQPLQLGRLASCRFHFRLDLRLYYVAHVLLRCSLFVCQSSPFSSALTYLLSRTGAEGQSRLGWIVFRDSKLDLYYGTSHI